MVNPTAPRPAWPRRVPVLDWIRVGLFVLGGVCVATGLLPFTEAEATMRRVLPILAFLATVIILAELTAEAGVFDVIAARIAIAGRGRFVALFGMCGVFAAVTTIALNLDTTAVLLFPVMLATARKVGMPGLPLAMTTLWLANTASLLLPVSNLTNLLAANRVDLGVTEYAQVMGLPQVASIAVTMVCLWAFYWRPGVRGLGGGGPLGHRYTVPPAHTPRDRTLFWTAAGACVVFLVCVAVNAPLQIASTICAALLAVAFAVRMRDRLRWSLLPWRLLIFVTGLFLVVQTISAHGLDDVMRALIGPDGGAGGVFRAAGTGAGAANLVNNLPTYLAGEAVVAPANHTQLLGLLIGTNVGPLVTPWASLATLLCYERARAEGVRVPLGRFVWTGLATAVATLLASVTALVLTG
jgi:arsenical pump membrane protein